jgi:DNA-binding MarR family transcriptional regulator
LYAVAVARPAAPDACDRCGGSPPLGLLISQVGRSVSRGFHDALAPLGLEPRQYLLLRSVADAEGCSQQAVGGSLQIPPSRMVVLVDALEARGLILRVPNPADRRAYALRLTPAGRRLLAKARPVSEAFDAGIGEALSDTERTQLAALLARIAESRGLHSRFPDPGAPPVAAIRQVRS